ncbi:hypothetical protein [Spirosoma sp. KNUC1025]|uniref:hypothetical protein n=1 Tax=Spirosoma sp. KNUC1025 TaxID=2894082 RepID=UPI003868D620|nr:hypothetical protein LN737_15150 [Spirosoma sp. KNUC1025]
MITQPSFDDSQSSQDWKNYQHIIGLPTFREKLDYWCQEVCKTDLVFGILALDGATFCLEAKTDDERRLLHEFWFNWYRTLFIDEGYAVEKAYWRSKHNTEKMAFQVKSIDILKADLQNRLAGATRKKDLTHKELTIVTDTIDGSIYPDASFTDYKTVDMLRDCWERKTVFDFAFSNGQEALAKVIEIAQFWDITKYEAYLKDILYNLHYNSEAVETVQNSANGKRPLTREEKLQCVQRILKPLNGVNPNKQPIMDQDSFDRLSSYTISLILDDRLPNDIKVIPCTNISNEHIRFTFYRLQKELFGKPVNGSIIDFLHSVFRQFENTSPKTTRSKFSSPPKSYDRDFGS